MSLLQQIKNDQLTARKNREAIKASLLTTLIGEAANIGKNDGNRETTDAEVVAVVKKFVKGLDEIITVAITYTDKDKAEQSIAEKAILQVYLPKQMTEAELSVAIADIKTEVGATNPKDMGKVMAALKAKFEGQYDGKQASVLIKAALS